MESLDMNRVVSFSLKPYDTEAIKTVEFIKQHAKLNGITFSFLVLQALNELEKDLTKE